MTAPAFDSKDNHQIVSDDSSSYDETVAAFTFGDTTNKSHTLGYLPNIRTFFEPESGEGIWKLSEQPWSGVRDDIRASVKTTTSQLQFRYDNIDGSAHTFPVHYQIYEQGDTTDDNITFDSKLRYEKILAVVEGSFTASASGAYTTETVTNPTGAKNFFAMRWSLDNSTWVDDDVVQYASTGTSPNYVNATCHVDASNVYIEALNSYGTTKTIYYQVFIFQYTYDNATLNTNYRTFQNFSNNSADITISGTINNGQRKDWETTIDIDSEALGCWFVSRDDVSGTEYQYPYRPLDFTFTASNLLLNTQIEYGSSQITIKASMWNTSGTNRTIPTTVITYRYALFKV